MSVLVIILQFTLIGLPLEVFLQFLIGVVMVSVGLILFLIGVHLGLLPMGEMIGAALPNTGKISLVVLFAFLMGFVVTVAEPDVRVLATQIDVVSQGFYPQEKTRLRSLSLLSISEHKFHLNKH